MTEYPWYANVQDDSLEQGDIFEMCPVFLPSEESLDGAILGMDLTHRDVIVVSQTCDLVKGREKVTEVLLCALWGLSEMTEGFLATPKGREEARRGNVPGVHLIAASTLQGMERELRVVDFRRLHSLPLAFLRKRAVDERNRLRLLPPYREHLSQAFARYFMRVGLPVDIAPFK